MEHVEATLLSLKEQALKATKNKDGDFYRSYLADDAMAVGPFGVFDKEAIVKMMTGSEPPFRSVAIDDTRAVVLTADSGFVTYKATFESAKDERKRFRVFVTTIYAKTNGSWKGVFYQQTPIQDDAG